MADKKISELNSAAAVYDADDFALVQDGDTKQVNASAVKAYVKDGLSKSDVGLGNVDNTSDANKPVSTATQTALDLKQDAASAATLTGTQTLTNKIISGSSNTLSNIGNSSLTNSSITINGNTVSLGGSTTVSAATTNTLTIGTGLSGTSFNGSSATTIAIDSSVVTLTGTQTLTNKTLTSPAISGGTANNVAIGGTTPAAGAFTTLSSTGNTTLGDASGDTLTINGTAVSIPNNLNFDSNTLFIDAANNQVGIGTSSPNAKLQVVGAAQVGNFSTSAHTAFTVGATSSDTGGIKVRFGNSATLQYSYIGDWYTGETSYIQFIRNSGTGVGQISIGTSPSGFSPIDRLIVDASGNLGLGVTPGAIGGGHTAFSILAQGNGLLGAATSIHLIENCYWNGSAWVRVDTTAPGYIQLVDGNFKFFNGVGGTAGGTFSPNQAMTLDASGKLVVGGTNLLLSGTHSFYGSSAANGPLTLRNDNSAAGRYHIVGPDANANFVIYNNATTGVYLSYGTTSWTANSDERLKTDLVQIEHAAQKVSTLRAVTGRYKTDEIGVSRAFLIAQDVQAVLPEAVDAADSEKLGIRYTDTIPLLVAAIQELHAEIELLKAKVN